MIILCILFSPFSFHQTFHSIKQIYDRNGDFLVFHHSFPFFFVLSPSENQLIRESVNRVIRRFWFSHEQPPGIAECFGIGMEYRPQAISRDLAISGPPAPMQKHAKQAVLEPGTDAVHKRYKTSKF